MSSAALLPEGQIAGGDLEQGRTNTESNAVLKIFMQSSHPIALFFLFFFRTLAVATYILSGLFSSSFVLSTVVVIFLLALDFWTVRNVSGRVLVGLRFWNQVLEDGSNIWVYEHQPPEDRPVNKVDSKMFWIALYVYPVLWLALLVVGFLKFNVSFLPIVVLALTFNVLNALGYTYAERDARVLYSIQGSSWIDSLTPRSLGLQAMSSYVQSNVGKLFG